MGCWWTVLIFSDLVRLYPEDLTPIWPNFREENARDLGIWEVLRDEEMELDKIEDDTAMIYYWVSLQKTV